MATERLGHLAKGGRLLQPQVKGELVGRLGNPCQHGEHLVILLARMGLSADRHRLEPQGLHHTLLELLGGAVTACQQVRIRGRGAHSALQALAADGSTRLAQGAVIVQEILTILRQTVAEGGRLSRLQMGIGHRNRIGLSLDTRRQGAQDLIQQREQHVAGIAHSQRIGVIFDIHAGSAQMDDRPAHRALFGIGTHLSHQIVVQIALELLSALPVDIPLVSTQLG